MKRCYVIRYRDGSYYTVFGWEPATTKHVIHAVVFPNERFKPPEWEDGMKRVTVVQEPGEPFFHLPEQRV